MRLFVHTSQSFVQSYRRFERNSYVHIFSTSSAKDSIGLPRQYKYSYFYQAS